MPASPFGSPLIPMPANLSNRLTTADVYSEPNNKGFQTPGKNTITDALRADAASVDTSTNAVGKPEGRDSTWGYRDYSEPHMEWHSTDYDPTNPHEGVDSKGKPLEGFEKAEDRARHGVNDLQKPYEQAANENPYAINQENYNHEASRNIDVMERAGSEESVRENLNPMMDQMLQDTMQTMAGSAGAQLQSSAQNARTADQIGRMSGEMWDKAFDQSMKKGDMAGQAALHADKKRQALNEATHDFTQLGADLEAALMDMWGGITAAEKSTVNGSSCVPLGTLIKMADGSLKRIEDIKPGDCVKSWKTNGKRGEAKVWHVYKSIDPVLCYDIICKCGSVFTVSRDHAMQTKFGITCIEKFDIAEYIPVRKLKAGMKIMIDDGWCEVQTIVSCGPKHIAELFLEKDYYYSLANGLVSFTPSADVILQTVSFDHISYNKYGWPKEYRYKKPLNILVEFVKCLILPFRRLYANTFSK